MNVASFTFFDELGGLTEEFSQSHFKRIEKKGKRLAQPAKISMVTCHPLVDILAACRRNGTTIDYFSLDTEGSEAAILATIDFTRIRFGVITVEHNNDKCKHFNTCNIVDCMEIDHLKPHV